MSKKSHPFLHGLNILWKLKTIIVNKVKKNIFHSVHSWIGSFMAPYEGLNIKSKEGKRLMKTVIKIEK